MSKILTVYYSYGGNTKKIAEKVQKTLGGEIAEIQTIARYPADYDEVVNQGADEVKRGFKPEIAPLGVNVKDFDIIIIGTPVWWYTFAPAVKTFLESNDFSGKKVYVFATNGGWIGHTFKDVEKACGANCAVGKGLNLRFDGATMRTSEAELTKWLQTIK